jgi:hypothetical protein
MITSIDPEPRAEIDPLCDRVIRARMQTCDPAIFDELEPGDILFLDASHYVRPDSDVTVFFLEVLPKLKPGIVVHVHDIFLPLDYIPRFGPEMNEQYMLAVLLLCRPAQIKVLLANHFVCWDTELSRKVKEIFRRPGGEPEIPFYYKYRRKDDFPGTSFWFETIERGPRSFLGNYLVLPPSIRSFLRRHRRWWEAERST